MKSIIKKKDIPEGMLRKRRKRKIPEKVPEKVPEQILTDIPGEKPEKELEEPEKEPEEQKRVSDITGFETKEEDIIFLPSTGEPGGEEQQIVTIPEIYGHRTFREGTVKLEEFNKLMNYMNGYTNLKKSDFEKVISFVNNIFTVTIGPLILPKNIEYEQIRIKMVNIKKIIK
uniref:Uncharacterized protein n=1 Tax=Pithovirus LCDPAC02 TaxID=2506601 RepID=A0A481YNH8_9VIRU|nr:MAG: hypothetical protein LCDPAC02_00370 [Pithovirus LCDPAC02]